MKRILSLLALCFMLLVSTGACAQDKSAPIQHDFEGLLGTWQGSLTYLDYSSGKPYTMPANIAVKRIDKSNKFAFANSYPNEASANSVDTISISPDGKYIDKGLVTSRRELPKGIIEIITEVLGKDGNDNKPATVRHTYTLSPTTYSNSKDVQFIGETKWIRRHEYAYKKLENQ